MASTNHAKDSYSRVSFSSDGRRLPENKAFSGLWPTDGRGQYVAPPMSHKAYGKMVRKIESDAQKFEEARKFYEEGDGATKLATLTDTSATSEGGNGNE